MIKSIEGKRGYPRNRPPYIAEVGLFGRPTLNQNVETLYWVPEILAKGAKWFADQGINGAKGPRSWSVSGRVKKPGVILAPAGLLAGADRARRRHGGGTSSRPICLAGPRAAFCPPALRTCRSISEPSTNTARFVGSHAIVIFSDRDDIGAVVLNLLRFFKDESAANARLAVWAATRRWRCSSAAIGMRRLLNELAQAMRDASICGLGQAAPNAFITALEHFTDEPARTEVAGQPDR